MTAPSDCRECGACCFSAGERFVAVTGADWARLGPAAGVVAHFIGHRAFMKMAAGHCAALAFRPAGGAGATFCCTVYDRRPQVCRDLDRGSPQCEGERTKGFSIREARVSLPPPQPRRPIAAGAVGAVSEVSRFNPAGAVPAPASKGNAAVAKNVALGATTGT